MPVMQIYKPFQASYQNASKDVYAVERTGPKALRNPQQTSGKHLQHSTPSSRPSFNYVIHCDTAWTLNPSSQCSLSPSMASTHASISEDADRQSGGHAAAAGRMLAAESARLPALPEDMLKTPHDSPHHWAREFRDGVEVVMYKHEGVMWVRAAFGDGGVSCVSFDTDALATAAHLKRAGWEQCFRMEGDVDLPEGTRMVKTNQLSMQLPGMSKAEVVGTHYSFSPSRAQPLSEFKEKFWRLLPTLCLIRAAAEPRAPTHGSDLELSDAIVSASKACQDQQTRIVLDALRQVVGSERWDHETRQVAAKVAEGIAAWNPHFDELLDDSRLVGWLHLGMVYYTPWADVPWSDHLADVVTNKLQFAAEFYRSDVREAADATSAAAGIGPTSFAAPIVELLYGGNESSSTAHAPRWWAWSDSGKMYGPLSLAQLLTIYLVGPLRHDALVCDIAGDTAKPVIGLAPLTALLHKVRMCRKLWNYLKQQRY